MSKEKKDLFKSVIEKANPKFLKDKRNWLGVDGGFGYFKVAFYDDDGELRFIKFLSVLAYANNDHKFDQLVEYKGKRYWVGESALLQPTEQIQDIKDYTSLKKHHPILLHHAIKMAGKEQAARDGKLNIVVGLSPAHSDDRESFLEENISYTIDGETFHHNSIFFKEQGGGAISALNHKVTYKSFIVVDGGFNTIDVAQAFKTPQGISVASLGAHEGRGFIMVAEKVRSLIASEYKYNVSIKEVTEIIENGYFDVRGKRYNIKEIIRKAKAAYTKGLTTFLENKYGEYFNKSEKVFFVGGVAYFISPSKENANFKVVGKAEFYNAIGYLTQGIVDYNKYLKENR